MKFHHIGIACASLEELNEYLRRHFNVVNQSEPCYDALQDATLCLWTMHDGLVIEGVCGTVVERLVKKGTYLYHTCYEVENIESAQKELLEDQGILVAIQKPAILFNYREVCFIQTPIGLIELLQA